MTHHLTPRIEELCRRITEEKDQKTFQKLVDELNQLLQEKEQTLTKQFAA